MINALPCRVRFDLGTEISTVLDVIQSDHIESIPFSQSSFSVISKAAGFGENQRPFNTAFVLENLKGMTGSSSEHKWKMSQLDDVAKSNFNDYDLMLVVFPETNGITLNLEFDGSKCNSSVAKRLLHFMMSVTQRIGDALLKKERHQILKFFTSLNSAEEKQLLDIGRGTQIALPTKTSHELFEQVVRKNREKIALEFEGQSMTYSELDNQSDAVALELIDRGVKVGDFVGIVTSRSMEMVVGILGVLKAGAAYVPIDSSIPLERITYILETAACTTVLYLYSTEKQIIDALGDRKLLKLKCQVGIKSQTRKHTLPTVPLDSPAYAVFTSGSTGNPKGVVICHKSLVNFAGTPSNVLNVNPGTSTAQVCSIGFDACATEIFCTILNGGKLVLASEKNLTNAIALATNILLTPSLLAKLSPDDYPHIKRVVSVAEALPKDVLNTWASRVEFVNGYGPSETTMGSSWKQLCVDDQVTVGKPIWNSVQYIVDKDLQLVPFGVAGELVIGGVGVSMGYLNRPDLTAEKFVPNHFINDGSLMYRTGDLCRWTESGEIVIIGRMDDMVKVKGYRIELDEVAAAIDRNPKVEACAVIVKNDMLVAYVTPKDVDVDAIRESVLDILPFYMTPSVIVALSEFPLNNNGKVIITNFRLIKKR